MNGAAKPLVGLIMGSDSDWPKVRAAKTALDECGVACEVRVLSAHRTPQAAAQYAAEAAGRGLKVLIAAAGGAAHLAGVLAAHTTLPVIGLPVPTPELGGLDSLLSTVQMPSGVPVACMAVGMGGARNAGLLAAQILATADPALRARLEELRRRTAAGVAEKDARLQAQLAAEAEGRTTAS